MKKLVVFTMLFFVSRNLTAAGNGTSGGLTLLESPGARASALGEAFSAISDDITGMAYNPASLNSLKSGQTSFMYQKGLMDDARGEFMIGVPTEKRSVGLSVGYFNGGRINANQNGATKSVNVQTDLNATVAYGQRFGGLSVGLAGKYLSSELIETEKAKAYAFDAGLQVQMSEIMKMGMSIQNFGSKLRFGNSADDLPRLTRAGMAIKILSKKIPTTFLLDGEYNLNEATLHPLLGLESLVGPLSIRAGYKIKSDLKEFTIGAGFMVSHFNFDYSFALLTENISQQHLSVSTRFQVGKTQTELVNQQMPAEKRPASAIIPIEPKTNIQFLAPKSRVYIVEPGDTLESISIRLYGHADKWRTISQANQHLYRDLRELKPGQKILVPVQ